MTSRCYVSEEDWLTHWGPRSFVPYITRPKGETMTTTLVTHGSMDPQTVERVLLHGDLKQLTPAQKVSYYKAVCDSVGLNPLTQPFQYLVLNGKEVLYARRDATEQLRQIHSVSVQIMTREVCEDCYVVTARATLPSGRTDENIGAVPIATLKGEARANAMMKAETKAKRRVTLAICGLGMLDETEVASIPNAQVGYVVEAPIAPVPLLANELPPAKHPDANTYAPEGMGVGTLGTHLPDGVVYIVKVTPGFGKVVGEITTHTGETLPIFKDQLKSLAEQVCQERCLVQLQHKTAASGKDYLIGIVRADLHRPETDSPRDAMLDADEVF